MFILGKRQMSIATAIHVALERAEKCKFLRWQMIAGAQKMAFFTPQVSGCPLKILFFWQSADSGRPATGTSNRATACQTRRGRLSAFSYRDGCAGLSTDAPRYRRCWRSEAIKACLTTATDSAGQRVPPGVFLSIFDFGRQTRQSRTALPIVRNRQHA